MYRISKGKNWTFHYLRYGKVGGTPLLLLHGYSDSARTFDPLREYLRGKYRVYVPDFPMMHKKKVAYDLSALTAFVYAFVRRVRLKKFVLAGFSFGGLVAVEFAREHPGRVKKLYLLSCVPHFRAPEVVDKLLGRWNARSISPFFFLLWSRIKTSRIGRLFTPKTKRRERSMHNVRERPFSVLVTLYLILRDNILEARDRHWVADFLALPFEKYVVLAKDDEILDYGKYGPRLKRAGVKVVAFSKGGHGRTEEYWENLKKVF